MNMPITRYSQEGDGKIPGQEELFPVEPVTPAAPASDLITDEMINMEFRKLRTAFFALPSAERTPAKLKEMVTDPVDAMKAKQAEQIKAMPKPTTLAPSSRPHKMPNPLTFKRVPKDVLMEHPELTAMNYAIARFGIEIAPRKTASGVSVFGIRIYKYFQCPEIPEAAITEEARRAGLQGLELWQAVVAGYGYADKDGHTLVKPKPKADRIHINDWHNYVSGPGHSAYLVWPKKGSPEADTEGWHLTVEPVPPESMKAQVIEEIWQYTFARLKEGGDLHDLVISLLNALVKEGQAVEETPVEESTENTGSIFMDWQGRQFTSMEELAEVNIAEAIDSVRPYAASVDAADEEIGGAAQDAAFNMAYEPELAMAAKLIPRLTALAQVLDEKGATEEATALDAVTQEVAQAPSKEDGRLNRVTVEVKPVAVFDNENKATKKFQGRFFRFNPKYRGKGRVSQWYPSTVIVPEDKSQYDTAVEAAKKELMDNFKAGKYPEFYNWIHLMQTQLPTKAASVKEAQHNDPDFREEMIRREKENEPIGPEFPELKVGDKIAFSEAQWLSDYAKGDKDSAIEGSYIGLVTQIKDEYTVVAQLIKTLKAPTIGIEANLGKYVVVRTIDVIHKVASTETPIKTAQTEDEEKDKGAKKEESNKPLAEEGDSTEKYNKRDKFTEVQWKLDGGDIYKDQAIVKQLTRLANELDELGLTEEATELDNIVTDFIAY